MDLLDLLNPLFNFAAPAAFLASVLALAGRLFGGARAGAPRWWMQWLVVFAVGVMVLVAGLVAFDRDGMIATYAALVAACGSAQWLAMRGWRR